MTFQTSFLFNKNCAGIQFAFEIKGICSQVQGFSAQGSGSSEAF